MEKVNICMLCIIILMLIINLSNLKRSIKTALFVLQIILIGLEFYFFFAQIKN